MLEPHNAYAQRVRAGDWAICETAAARARSRSRRGLPARLRPQRGRRSRRACRRGVWPLPGVEPGALGRPLADRRSIRVAGRRGAIGAHGEARWHATRELSNDEPATIHLGLDVFAPAGQRGARAARRLASSASASGELVLAADGARTCAWPGSRPPSRRATTSPAGALVGHASQRRRRPAAAPARAGRAPPASTLPGPRAAGARARRGSRSARTRGALLGLAAAGARRTQRAARAPPRRDPAGRSRSTTPRRPRSCAASASTSTTPTPAPTSTASTTSPSLGHSHPRVTAAATRQLRLLNTNSRFLYESMTRFAERLAALAAGAARRGLPRLDRLRGQRPRAAPRARRDRPRATCSASATPTTAGRPRPTRSRRARSTTRCGAQSPPEGVHPVLSPDTYRGPYGAGEPDAGARYAEPCARRSSALAADGRAPAAFICEALYGNAGGIVLPDGYLRGRLRARARRRAASASPTRCRSATAGWARTSGASSSRASCPTSSRSRRRPATATRSRR